MADVPFLTKDRSGADVSLPTAKLIDDRLAAIFGSASDTAWDGTTPNPSFIAMQKRQLALLSDSNPSVVSSLTKRAVASSFTRPANTTNYTTGGLMGNVTTVSGFLPLEFVNAGRANGGRGTITAASVRSQSIRGGADAVRLHLFRDAPVITVGGDGTSFATAVALRAAIHLGSFDINLDMVGTDGTLGHAAPRNRGSIVYECGTGSTSLYGLLEARSAITGISGELLGASLELIQDA